MARQPVDYPPIKGRMGSLCVSYKYSFIRHVSGLFVSDVNTVPAASLPTCSDHRHMKLAFICTAQFVSVLPVSVVSCFYIGDHNQAHTFSISSPVASPG